MPASALRWPPQAESICRTLPQEHHGTHEMHCFRQCIRPIHSAHKKEPRPNTRAGARRTSSVRRQSAARRSCSSKQPPLAASLPAKEAGAVTSADHTSPDGVFGRTRDLKAPQPFRSCACRVITPAQTGRDCLAARSCRIGATIPSGPSPETPLGSRRVLLRPHSPTTAFGGMSAGRFELPLGCAQALPMVALLNRGSATSTWPTRPGTGVPTPEAAVVPALASVSDSEVTLLGRVTARSAWVCAAFRQAILSRRISRISPYENRSSGYRSHTDVRDSAPSPQNLTGKPSLTYSVGPFVVELFTAIGFADGRRGGRPRFRLSPDGSSPRQPR
jgi:hypothetical protein